MIVGSMVVRDEANRYLQASLSRLLEVCDKVFVADDGSMDNSVEMARSMGCSVWERPDSVKPFAVNESVFRSAAWNTLGETMSLNEDDWVLSIDADEYLMASRKQLEEMAVQAGQRNAFTLSIREAWSLDPVLIRVDGFWRENHNRRVHRWNKEAKFRNVTMGCGSVPDGGRCTEIHKIQILHFGYALEEDRLRKYDFYKSLPSHGHNESHIESILSKPTLERFDEKIKFWRGMK